MSSFQYEDVSAATLASSSWCVLKFFHCITLVPSLAGLTVKLPFRMFGLCGRKHWSHSLSPGTLRWCVLGRVRILNLGPRLTYDPGLFLAVRSPLTDLFFPAGGDTRLFNSPVRENQFRREEEKTRSKLPPYNRLTWHTSTSRTEHPQNAKLCFQFMWLGITFTSRRLCPKMWSIRSKMLWTQISTLFFIGLKICHKKWFKVNSSVTNPKWCFLFSFITFCSMSRCGPRQPY